MLDLSDLKMRMARGYNVALYMVHGNNRVDIETIGPKLTIAWAKVNGEEVPELFFSRENVARIIALAALNIDPDAAREALAPPDQQRKGG